MTQNVYFSRRQMLQTAACGFGGLALADTLLAATGALFAFGEGMPGMFARVADVPLPDIARLYKWQREGARIESLTIDGQRIAADACVRSCQSW